MEVYDPFWRQDIECEQVYEDYNNVLPHDRVPRATNDDSPCGIFVKFAFNLFLIIWPPTSLIVLSQNVRVICMGGL